MILTHKLRNVINIKVSTNKINFKPCQLLSGPPDPPPHLATSLISTISCVRFSLKLDNHFEITSISFILFQVYDERREVNGFFP